MDSRLIELKEELNNILCYEPINSKRVLLLSQEIDKVILEIYTIKEENLRVS